MSIKAGGGAAIIMAMRIADNDVGAGGIAQLPLWHGASEMPAAELRHSRRARRVAVRIDAMGRVELVVPRGVSETRARAFLASRAEWITRHLQRRRQLAKPMQPFPPAGIELAALGEHWRLFLAGGTGRFRVSERCPGMLELRGCGADAQLQRQLIRWLTQRAHAVLAPQLQELARRHGFSYSTLKLRRQRTRWGSCSARGVITLNLASLFQPPEVLRYLMCHELAHTRHMNHSARFWRCVEQCEPGFRGLDAQLSTGWTRVPTWLLESP
jgi:predicted metal-dependent hydrolase